MYPVYRLKKQAAFHSPHVDGYSGRTNRTQPAVRYLPLTPDGASERQYGTDANSNSLCQLAQFHVGGFSFLDEGCPKGP